MSNKNEDHSSDLSLLIKAMFLSIHAFDIEKDQKVTFLLQIIGGEFLLSRKMGVRLT